MIIRKATIDDAEWILIIRNNENIYKFFKIRWPVSLDDHSKWLQDYLQNEKNQYFVSEEDNGEISWYIRKDHINDFEYGLSIAINENYQKQWIAGKLLQQVLAQSKRNHNIYAEIQKTNIASLHFFKKNWFNFYEWNENYEKLMYNWNQ